MTLRAIAPRPRAPFAPLAFFVVGLPATQGSKRIVMRGPRPRVVEMAKGHQRWRRDIAQAALVLRSLRREILWPLTEAVTCALTFYVLRPARPSRLYPQGDLDKLCRAILDGLVVGRVLRDDVQVVTMTAAKQYAVPGSPCGCAITITNAEEASRG